MWYFVIIVAFLTISDGSIILDGSSTSGRSSISDSHQGTDSVLAEVLSRIKHLEAENKELKTRLAETEGILKAQTKTIERLQNQINDLSNRVESSDSKQEETPNPQYSKNSKQHLIKEPLKKKQQNRVRGKRQVSEYGVAFTAYLDHVETSLGQEQTMIYNQALLNDGNAYSNNTGIFRAPVPGVYLFSWSVMARRRSDQSGYDVRVDLIHNGVQVLTAVAESRTELDDNQGSNTAVIRLAAGDEVWTHHRSGASQTHGGATDRETSFTGVLLYEEERTEVVVG